MNGVVWGSSFIFETVHGIKTIGLEPPVEYVTTDLDDSIELMHSILTDKRAHKIKLIGEYEPFCYLTKETLGIDVDDRRIWLEGV